MSKKKQFDEKTGNLQVWSVKEQFDDSPTKQFGLEFDEKVSSTNLLSSIAVWTVEIMEFLYHCPMESN